MAQVWVRTHSITSMLYAHCGRCVSWLSLFDDSTFLSLSSTSSLLSPCPSFCPWNSSSRMWWTNSMGTTANECLGTVAEYDPLTGSEPNDYHITEGLWTLHPGILGGAAVPELLRPRWLTSPSARRSLMRAEDEPVTFKKKVCRPVCRCPPVMIERWDPLWTIWLSSFECSRNSETQLRKRAKKDSSGTTKRADSRWLWSRFENTNPRPIMA